MDEFLLACELHDPDRLKALLDAGFDARAPLGGKRPIDWLLEMYTRSDRFASCVRRLLDRGAVLDEPGLGPVLTNDEATLSQALEADPSLTKRRVTIHSAFTPLEGVTLLHVAAEYGHAGAARVLLGAGADVNAAAAVDAYGLGGQTPLFHTVNAHANRPLPVLQLLLDGGARLDVRLQGLTWGRGFEWETTLFDVTPLSFAQAGLIPQMHRDERDVDLVVRRLLEAAGRPVPPMPNVPNRYLSASRQERPPR